MLKIITIAFILLAPFKWIYVVDNAKCNGCANCLSHCPQNAITMRAGDAYIDPELCDGCGNCVNYCPRNAIFKEWYTGIEDETTTETMLFSQNPVSDNSVLVTGLNSLTEVDVLDRAGRIVLTHNADNEGNCVLDVSSIPEGVYLVRADNQISVLTTI